MLKGAGTIDESVDITGMVEGDLIDEVQQAALVLDGEAVQQHAGPSPRPGSTHAPLS